MLWVRVLEQKREKNVSKIIGRIKKSDGKKGRPSTSQVIKDVSLGAPPLGPVVFT